MLNDILIINKAHEKAALTIFDKVMEERKDKYIITITGEVGVGKCEVSHVLGKLFKNKGVMVKIIHMDDYYKIPPAMRTDWRKKHGTRRVGFEEYDWEMINRNIDDFRNNRKSELPSVDLMNDQVDKLITDFDKIELLIINGLYSIKIDSADLKVFIELTYKDTFDEQKATGKEPLDEFRLKVLQREHEVIQTLKSEADFYVDFDENYEVLHF
jgi:uridine kinase